MPSVEGSRSGADRCCAHFTPDQGTGEAGEPHGKHHSDDEKGMPSRQAEELPRLAGLDRLRHARSISEWRVELRRWEIRFDDEVLSAHTAAA